MITPYYGEFLISPIPLELSMNYCSHKCGYCFANLNSPKRKHNLNRTMRLLNHHEDRSTLQAQLLAEKYPICISNRVDPFATSNYKETLLILNKLADLGVPVQFQTRGGRGVEDALTLIGPTVWYITINILNEDLRRKIEPGATSIKSRFELIDRLISLGHPVVLGLNPAVPEWLPHPRRLLSQAARLGVKGVWVERLHLYYKQENNMSQRERSAIGADNLERARKRITHPKDLDYFYKVRDIAQELGLTVYSVGQPDPSEFFAPYREIYPKTFPVYQDFINALAGAGYEPNHLIDLDQFLDFFAPKLPQGDLPLAYYLGATSRDLFRRREISHFMSFSELLRIIWEDPKTKYSLVKSPAFAYAAHPLSQDKRHWIQLMDEKNRPYIVYNKAGFENYHHKISLF